MFWGGREYGESGKKLSGDGWVGRGMRWNRTVIRGGGSLRFSHFRNEWKYQKLLRGQSKRLCSMCAVVKNGGGREEWRIATVLFGYGSNLTGNSRSHSNPPYPPRSSCKEGFQFEITEMSLCVAWWREDTGASGDNRVDAHGTRTCAAVCSA